MNGSGLDLAVVLAPSGPKAAKFKNGNTFVLGVWLFRILTTKNAEWIRFGGSDWIPRRAGERTGFFFGREERRRKKTKNFPLGPRTLFQYGLLVTVLVFSSGFF